MKQGIKLEKKTDHQWFEIGYYVSWNARYMSSAIRYTPWTLYWFPLLKRDKNLLLLLDFFFLLFHLQSGKVSVKVHQGAQDCFAATSEPILSCLPHWMGFSSGLLIPYQPCPNLRFCRIDLDLRVHPTMTINWESDAEFFFSSKVSSRRVRKKTRIWNFN